MINQYKNITTTAIIRRAIKADDGTAIGLRVIVAADGRTNP